MPAIPFGEQVKVWIQTPDGRVLEVPCVATPISHTMREDRFQRPHIELEAVMPPTWMSTDLYNQALKIRRTAKEYRCSWCGSPNKIHRTHCVQCCGARDFLIGE